MVAVHNLDDPAVDKDASMVNGAIGALNAVRESSRAVVYI